MPISFNGIPENWKQPLYWIETDPSQAGFPTTFLPALIVGYKTASGSQPADVPIAVSSVEDARAYFGNGSQLALMVEWFLKGNTAATLYAIPVAEPSGGTAASATVTCSAAPTQAGTLSLYVAGRRVQVFIAADDTTGEVSTKLVAAINADPQMPVIASQATTDAPAMLLTAKFKGIEGNDIDVRFNYGGAPAGEVMPTTLAFTGAPAKLATGTGSPVLTTMMANLGDEPYEYVALGFNDSTTFGLFTTEYGFGDTGRWGWMRQLYGHLFSAKRDTYANLMTYGPSNNSGVLSVMTVEVNSPTPIWCWAAAYCAKAARGLLNDPARPLQTLALDGCLPAPKHQRFTDTERNNLASVGLATQAVNGDGVPAIKRETTTYQKNLHNQGDDAYELVPTLATLAKLFRNQRHAITSKYPRHKLANDGTRFGPGQAIVTPKIVKAELVAQYRRDEYNGLVEDAPAFKKNLIVERDSNNHSRLNVLYPPDLVNQLRIFAVLAQFRLQYNRGVDTDIT